MNYICILASFIYYSTPLVHDIGVTCAVCACAEYHVYFESLSVEAGWRRKLDSASWDGI